MFARILHYLQCWFTYMRTFIGTFASKFVLYLDRLERYIRVRCTRTYTDVVSPRFSYLARDKKNKKIRKLLRRFSRRPSPKTRILVSRTIFLCRRHIILYVIRPRSVARHNRYDIMIIVIKTLVFFPRCLPITSSVQLWVLLESKRIFSLFFTYF